MRCYLLATLVYCILLLFKDPTKSNHIAIAIFNYCLQLPPKSSVTKLIMVDRSALLQ